MQTNSATSEESAAASEELSSQAALMKELMQRFKLRSMEGYTGLDSYRSSYSTSDNSYEDTGASASNPFSKY